jgi:hypothetical protein
MVIQMTELCPDDVPGCCECPLQGTQNCPYLTEEETDYWNDGGVYWKQVYG